MKQSRRHSEFNTRAEMFARAIFLLMHVAFAFGIIATAAGLLSIEPKLMLAGLAALIAGWNARSWLRKTGELVGSERALQSIAEGVPPLDDASVAELIALLEQWESLEQKRGSPDFDPWAVQAVRHDICVVVQRDPALQYLFTTLRRAA
jgi:hypothetical protein